MNKLTVIAVAALLAGCRPVVPDEAGPMSAQEARWVEAAFDTWESRGREIPSNCATWKFRIVRDEDAFEAWCGVPTANEDQSCPQEGERCALGCYKLGRRPRSTARREEKAIPVIAIVPWADVDFARFILVHETFHYLSECAGHGHGHAYLGDPLHIDGDVWGEGGMVFETVDRLIAEEGGI